jgi:ankyrin repeat protein
VDAREEVNARDKDNWTPLHITAQYNSTDVAQLLLQYICEVDARMQLTNSQHHFTSLPNTTLLM